MGLRITEIDEDAVAHIFRHEPAEPAHGLGDAFLISRNNLAQILGVHARGEGRRADKVREHHRDLAAFGGIMRLRRNGCRSRRSKLWRTFLDTIQLGYRAQQLTPMTKRGHP